LPLKNGHLTAQERAFIDAMARTGDKAYAAHKAGYANEAMSGNRLMKNPVVRAEVVRQAEETLHNDLLPLALATHKLLLTDKATPAGARLGAVKLVYDRTMGSGEKDDAEKEPSDMTAGELQRSIAKLKAELEGRPLTARDITPAEPSRIIDQEPDSGVFE
jgi:phage terminase small subunit